MELILTKQNPLVYTGEIMSKIKNIRKVKEYKSDYYSMNSIFGNDWAMFYVLLGGRCCGKSYAALEWCISRKQRKQDLTKLF